MISAETFDAIHVGLPRIDWRRCRRNWRPAGLRALTRRPIPRNHEIPLANPAPGMQNSGPPEVASKAMPRPFARRGCASFATRSEFADRTGCLSNRWCSRLTERGSKTAQPARGSRVPCSKANVRGHDHVHASVKDGGLRRGQLTQLELRVVVKEPVFHLFQLAARVEQARRRWRQGRCSPERREGAFGICCCPLIPLAVPRDNASGKSRRSPSDKARCGNSRIGRRCVSATSER